VRILLLNPPSSYHGKWISREQCGVGVVEERFVPSEILLSAAYLRRAGFDVDYRDLDGGDLDFSGFQVVVGWVSVLHSYHEDLAWLLRAKEAGCRTVMVLNEPYEGFELETLRRHPFVDAAVRLWERELGLEALLRAWQQGRSPRAAGLIVRDGEKLLDTGLHPRRNDLAHLSNCTEFLRGQALKEYGAVGITPGRGCHAGCRFCLYAESGLRKRPLDDVLGEIEAVAGKIPLLYLLDPDLAATRNWTLQFCRELSERKLRVRWRSDLRPEDADPQLLDTFRASGCEYVMVAVETLDPEIREKTGAGITAEQLRASLGNIRRAGIRPVVFFYVGLPWDTPASLERIERFLREEPIASFYIKQVRPWPGTPVGEAFRSLGLLPRTLGPEDFIHSDTPLSPTRELTIEELAEWKKRIGRAGILQPGYLWRFLRERRPQPRHLVQFARLLAGRNIFQ